MITIDDALLRRRLAWDEARAMAGGTLLAYFTAEAPVELQVERVEEGQSVGALRQFTLVMRGPTAPVYAQGTYRFSHERLGDYAFFCTAIGRVAAGVEYEACFSHDA